MVIVFLADGFEELEAVACIDLLRRAEVPTVVAGVGGTQITGAHGLTITADRAAEGMVPDDTLLGVVLPGGMPGTRNLEQDETVHLFAETAFRQGKLLGAICAAPSILGHMGLLDGLPAVCFPGFEQSLTKPLPDCAVCNHENRIVTARGAGVAVEFALELVAVLKGRNAADAIKDAIQCRR